MSAPVEHRTETITLYPGEISVALTAPELLGIVHVTETAIRRRDLSNEMLGALISVRAKARVALAALPKDVKS